MKGVEQLAELVHEASGIVLKPSQYPALRAALRRAVPGVDAPTFVERATGPLGGELVDRLLDEVTVKETFFLRDAGQLATIDWAVLRASARAAGSTSIRVWSAGCATGEEPYSLALLAREHFAPAEPPVRILGTDISRAALHAAAEGSYRPRALRELGDELQQRYFERVDGEYRVAEALRSLVELRRHNLAREPLPPLGTGPFDLIVCRNVFIYFDAETIDRVIGLLERTLAPDGVLVLGAADALPGTLGRPAPTTGVPRRTEPRRKRALVEALDAATHGRPREAVADAARLLAEDPLDADTYFLRGLAELECGEPLKAVGSLRRSLYVDPTFGLAAFTLGRAYDGLGDVAAARRSYEQALRTLDADDDRHEPILEQIDLGDVAAACRARLAALR
jgi:chemotaxis protein methyltransferase CheR